MIAPLRQPTAVRCKAKEFKTKAIIPQWGQFFQHPGSFQYHFRLIEVSGITLQTLQNDYYVHCMYHDYPDLKQWPVMIKSGIYV
jgi:hypothetical protein